MAIIGLQKGSGKRSRVREKSVKSQGILIWIMSGNPGQDSLCFLPSVYSGRPINRVRRALLFFSSPEPKAHR